MKNLFLFVKKWSEWSQKFNILNESWPAEKLKRVNAFLSLKFRSPGIYLSSFNFFRALSHAQKLCEKLSLISVLLLWVFFFLAGVAPLFWSIFPLLLFFSLLSYQFYRIVFLEDFVKITTRKVPKKKLNFQIFPNQKKNKLDLGGSIITSKASSLGSFCYTPFSPSFLFSYCGLYLEERKVGKESSYLQCWKSFLSFALSSVFYSQREQISFMRESRSLFTCAACLFQRLRSTSRSISSTIQGDCLPRESL